MVSLPIDTKLPIPATACCSVCASDEFTEWSMSWLFDEGRYSSVKFICSSPTNHGFVVPKFSTCLLSIEWSQLQTATRSMSSTDDRFGPSENHSFAAVLTFCYSSSSLSCSGSKASMRTRHIQQSTDSKTRMHVETYFFSMKSQETFSPKIPSTFGVGAHVFAPKPTMTSLTGHPSLLHSLSAKATWQPSATNTTHLPATMSVRAKTI